MSTSGTLGSVDKSSPVPLYHQAESQLEAAIRAGRYPVGTLLESEFELARTLGVSRLTLRKAVDRLVSKGLLVRERGVGTRVLTPRVKRSMVARLTGLQDDLAEAGIETSTWVRFLGPSPCPAATAAHLGIEPGTPVLRLDRLRYAENRPLAVMWNAFPLGMFDLSSEELNQKGLYELLREQGKQPQVANQTITAAPATLEEATMLDMAVGSPVLVLERVSFSGTGTCVEHSRTRYASDRYSLEMHLVGS